MTTKKTCPKCGADLAGSALEGLCPKCIADRLSGASATLQTVPPDPHPTDGTISAESVSASTSDPALGKLRYFGDYELLEEIARGGMGVVYRARQVSLNRIVAVKMILAGQLAGEAEVRRFHTEAEAAANLQHPNIVSIHEVGHQGGQHYFSMDYVEGENLAEYAQGKPLAAGGAVRIMKIIAEAIHFAHQRGTLHRDLKPQNVLLDAENRPHITDFGLAKQMKQGSDLTHTGSVLGSPSYMPPEQAFGRLDQIGPQSDVYSLGAILYQLLTGRPPFLGATPIETLREVTESEPAPPIKLNPRIPPDLQTICLKCLEKKPERRYASARALADELERFLNHEPILARPASVLRKSWSWFTRHPWAVAGFASVLFLLTVGSAFQMREEIRHLKWKA